MGNGTFAEQVDAAVMVMLYWAAMFAGGAVGAVGLPPPHAINDPIAVAIASHFILPPIFVGGSRPLPLFVWSS